MKTNKSAKSRFKVTATGKVLRHRKGRRHLLTGKSSNKKRSLAKAVELAPALAKKYARMMCVA